MEPELADKYPEIKTYFGKLISNPAVWVRFDWTPVGFHAQVIGPDHSWYIDPYYLGESYASYYKQDYRSTSKAFNCFVANDIVQRESTKIAPRSGDSIHQYRIAVATTGEYSQFHGGAAANALAAVTTTINRVTGIYEYEMAVRLILVANNDDIIYLNASTDPFDGNNDAYTLIDESQSVINSVIGAANYDIGHTFSTGAGGLAGLGVVCSDARKASGVTGSPSPVGDPYDVDYVAHEIGHQFGANHTFNGAIGNCGGDNRNASTAYEPGSGSTIMAYAGICGADDLQSHSDPIFHSASYDEIMSYINSSAGRSCGSSSALDNAIPSVNAGSDFTIPLNTPFVLTGSAVDADSGNALVYLWEERDLGPQATLSAADDGRIPLFRTYTQTSSNQRYFPKWQTLLNNTSDNAEKLPQLARTMSFRLTVRDGEGGVDADNMQVTVDGGSGPFRVTAPNGGSANSGSSYTVTWDVANTTAAPVSCAQVDILLSTDAGGHFDRILATATNNDGSHTLTMPDVTATKARVMVRCSNNIFFDISDGDFALADTPVYSLAVTLAGDGTGTVTSSSPAGGINCGSDCSESYHEGTSVTLNASAASGSSFAAWSGCNTVNGTTCAVTMNAAKSVTATFNLLPSACAHEEDLVLENTTESGTKTLSACQTITAGPAYNVGASANVTLRAGQSITLRPGFQVRASGRLRAQIDPSLKP
jgi:hypothetical protein